MKHARHSRGKRPALELTLMALVLLAAGYAVAAEPTVHKASYASPAPAASLMVRVALPDADADGQVRIGLYDSAQGYASERELIARTVRVERGEARIPLQGLQPGRYAFKIFHDRNANGQLDTGAFGIPTEPYFFSNDASDLFSAPEWEEASFRLSEGSYAYEVTLD